MTANPVLYYITDRSAFPGTETRRRLHLLLKIAEAARAGVNYIQLREKDMHARELELLAGDAIKAIRDNSTSTRLLINSRTDIALAAAADGVHLRSHDLSPGDVRVVVRACKSTESEPNAPASPFLIAVSCHNADDVSAAAHAGADFAVFAPVFEKKNSPRARPTGLTALAHACQGSIPVLALGGITLQNARACLDAGAAGIAAIRLFQENDVSALVRRLRAL
jgi:thiamine-phosphate pyrophosphorylase